MKSQVHIFLTCLFLIFAAPGMGLAEDSKPIDFTTQIRPILSNKCFHCHGPDEAERYGGLRLDTKAGALGETDSGLPAIVEGSLEESELYRRITSSDESERMPPPESGVVLDQKSIDLIRRWIKQGGEYAGHWAYQQPQRPELPKVEQTDWPRNEIDYFILQRLEQEGLKPQAVAEKTALIRRLTLDLTGLPPTPEEVHAFLLNENSDAYEQVVDELLSRPTFGEHWARMWLDLARYADSAGYADDPSRTIWAFRDYVIKSLNENKPFDLFTKEQLAGDLFPDPTDEQLIATAFHRNTLTNNEGGTIDEEFRNAAIIDRVNTTFAVWMGTTMACAQCHTHKYDPISQREYFQLFAIFNNTEDADKRDESPLLQYYTPEQKQQQIEWKQQIEELKKTLQTPTPALRDELAQWESRLSKPLELTPLAVTEFTAESKTSGELTPDHAVLVPEAHETDRYTLKLQPAKATVEKYYALQLQTLPLETLPGQGAGHANGNFVVTDLKATINSAGSQSANGRYVRVEMPGNEKLLSLAEVQVLSGAQNIAKNGKATQSSTDYNGLPERAIDGNTNGDYAVNSTTHTTVSKDPWWEVDLTSAQPIDQIVIWNRTDNNLHTRLKDFRISVLDADRNVVWQQMESDSPNPSKSYDISGDRTVVFSSALADYSQSGFDPAGVIDSPVNHETGWAVAGQASQAHQLTLISSAPFELKENEFLTVTIDQKSKYAQHTLGHFRLQLISDPRTSELAGLPTEILALVQKTGDERTTAEEKQLTEYFLANVAPGLKAERKQLSKLENQLKNMKPTTTVPVMQQLPEEKHRKSHIQIRGNYTSLGDEVQEGLPDLIQVPMESEQPSRLELAEWLVHPENPLTARVIANRYWEKLFGIGLVSTSEEFGSQGELPSHPELLDWMATELHRLNWDSKAFIKTLVMSAAYRQSSRSTPELLEIDPDNRLVSRGPRFRLSAEMVRDQALFVSGLLSEKMFGPPVNPPQPDIGLKAAFGGGIDWKTSSGEDRYRRALYTTWRRSNPYPSMAAFDAPNRETCIVRRDRTNTPLQAFVTLNDPVYVEAAQALGRRMQEQSDEGISEKIAFGFELCTSRKPTHLETNRLVSLYQTAQEEYAKTPEEALKLATDPLGPLPEGASPAEFAAWTLVGNVLLNLDEILMKP
ncbi:DUF1553 domain-containing protein [Rubinisphaera italica]|nr:DUF1553 domain-containing protein [Rubinisphaera italica]